MYIQYDLYEKIAAEKNIYQYKPRSVPVLKSTCKTGTDLGFLNVVRPYLNIVLL